MSTVKAELLITSTIEALHGGHKSVKPTDGATLIKDWIAVVKKEDATSGIADELHELHTQLGHKEPDAKKVAHLMKKLGDETAKAAKKADKEYQDSLQNLADSLHKFEKAIA